jgi:hypothetical protein
LVGGEDLLHAVAVDIADLVDRDQRRKGQTDRGAVQAMMMAAGEAGPGHGPRRARREAVEVERPALLDQGAAQDPGRAVKVSGRRGDIGLDKIVLVVEVDAQMVLRRLRRDGLGGGAVFRTRSSTAISREQNPDGRNRPGSQRGRGGDQTGGFGVGALAGSPSRAITARKALPALFAGVTVILRPPLVADVAEFAGLAVVSEGEAGQGQRSQEVGRVDGGGVGVIVGVGVFRCVTANVASASARTCPWP